MKHPIRFTAALLATALVLGGGLTAAQAQEDSGSSAANNSTAFVPRALTPTKLISPAVTEDDYVSVTPCRIVDTRAAVGALTAGTIRSYYVGGTQQFVNQGGKSGGCGIPVGATSIATAMTAIAPTGSGFMRAWPNGESEPNATVLNYAGDGSTGTGIDLALNTSSAQSLKVKNYGSTTHLVIDVVGYTIPPIHANLNPSGSVYSGTSRVLSVTHQGEGSLLVTVDRSTVGCQPLVTMHGGPFYASAYETGTNQIQVDTWADDADGRPSSQDLFVTLHVVC
jgi:hypothetical protein